MRGQSSGLVLALYLNERMSNIEDPFPVPKFESFTELEEQNLTQEPGQVVKKKRGRKPVHKLPTPTCVNQLTCVQISTNSEECKARNRTAQAAFRERRTAYIEQLETTRTQLEEKVENLQRSHRSVADECLILRYKNSLLERILLEKGLLS